MTRRPHDPWRCRTCRPYLDAAKLLLWDRTVPALFELHPEVTESELSKGPCSPNDSGKNARARGRRAIATNTPR
jgi:hypothetical protein